MARIFLISSLFIIISSCSNESASKKESENQQDSDSTQTEQINEYPSDPKFNDVAQFVAGFSGDDKSSVKTLESRASFKAYQKTVEGLWVKTNAKLPIIKEWTEKELKDINQDGGTLFYPFSGADFLHADLFFPDHDNIAMFALEPIGTFPDLNEKGKDTTLDLYLSGLNKSMNAILKLSFFRTIAMADDFESEMDGTLHVLLHFMARTKHKVLFQERVAIMPNGELTTEIKGIPDSSYIGNRFYFQRNGEDKVRTLTYFSVNVQNTAYYMNDGNVAKGLDTRKDLVAYFKKLNIKSTYLKSASYLMHRPSFSIIRNIILNESEHVLQDDSGIPVHFFDQKKWDLTFYGTYSFPISLFRERHQEDLKKIYEKKELPVKPLPFGIGYQYHEGTSNMMRASKK